MRDDEGSGGALLPGIAVASKLHAAPFIAFFAGRSAVPAPAIGPILRRDYSFCRQNAKCSASISAVAAIGTVSGSSGRGRSVAAIAPFAAGPADKEDLGSGMEGEFVAIKADSTVAPVSPVSFVMGSLTCGGRAFAA